MVRKLVYGLVLTSVVLLSCSKEEGVGGQATVTGTLNVDVYNVSGYQHTLGAQNTDIYIVYGTNDEIPDDNVETGYSGKFVFEHLRPGQYTIYTYSDCFTCSLGQDSVVVKSFTITDKKATLDLGEVTIIDRK